MVKRIQIVYKIFTGNLRGEDMKENYNIFINDRVVVIKVVGISKIVNITSVIVFVVIYFHAILVKNFKDLNNGMNIIKIIIFFADILNSRNGLHHNVRGVKNFVMV